MTATALLAEMKAVAAALILLPVTAGYIRGAEEPKLVTVVKPLPTALDSDFQFRKTKIYFLSERAPNLRGGYQPNQPEDQTESTVGGGLGKAGRLSNTAPSTKTATAQDASIMFERQYRLFGAVTKLDRRQRFGDYFDFFWRAKRPADITVRLEYRQEKLHAHVQAQEVFYPRARGNHKTEFKVVGDDYFDDGRVIAWRCLLIENGRIVAENRSYLWE
jgi:hypothetical protein